MQSKFYNSQRHPCEDCATNTWMWLSEVFCGNPGDQQKGHHGSSAELVAPNKMGHKALMPLEFYAKRGHEHL